MSTIDEHTVNHIANLAKLEFSDAEKENVQQDLNKILTFMDKLNEVNTDDVAPLLHPTESVNVLREDEAIQSISQEEALKNAPKKDSDYFKVPKVLSK